MWLVIAYSNNALRLVPVFGWYMYVACNVIICGWYVVSNVVGLWLVCGSGNMVGDCGRNSLSHSGYMV